MKWKNKVALGTIMTILMLLVASTTPVSAACTIVPDVHWMTAGTPSWYAAFAEWLKWTYGACSGYDPHPDGFGWDTNGEVLDLWSYFSSLPSVSVSTNWDDYANFYFNEDAIGAGNTYETYVEIYGTNRGSSYVNNDYYYYAYDPYWRIYRMYKVHLDHKYITVS